MRLFGVKLSLSEFLLLVVVSALSYWYLLFRLGEKPMMSVLFADGAMTAGWRLQSFVVLMAVLSLFAIPGFVLLLIDTCHRHASQRRKSP